MNAKTLSEIRKEAASFLNKSGIKSPDNDADLLIMDILDISRTDMLFRDNDKIISEELVVKIKNSLTRRASGEPIQYISGYAYFRNLKLSVGSGVLIPRPETEILAGIAIKDAPENASICDIGTGSGAISLSIAQERPDTKIIGIDISHKALEYANSNRSAYALDNVEFMHGDLLSTINENLLFDIIIANLPYVTEDEYSKLDTEVSAYEPKLALTGGNDGLDIIKNLIRQAPEHMKPEARLLLEFGSTHAPELKNILHDSKAFKDIEIINDLNGVPRFSSALKI